MHNKTEEVKPSVLRPTTEIIPASTDKIKYIRLMCKKCSNIVSRNYTSKEKFLLQKNSEGIEFYTTKLIYFKSIFLDKKTKLKKGNCFYLYQKVKCVQCNNKFGNFVKSATHETWGMIDSVLFSDKTSYSKKQQKIANEITNLFTTSTKTLINDDELYQIDTTSSLKQEKLIKNICKDVIDISNQKFNIY